MNQAATALNREQSPDEIQPRSGGRQAQLKPVATDRNSRWKNGRRVYEYKPGSWWSHLLFGLGMLAFLVIPPMLPGVTENMLIKGYLGFLVVSYGIVCIWGIVRGLSQSAVGSSARGRRRIN